MFGKRGKAKSNPVVSIEPEENEKGFRESVLSAWAVEPLTYSQGLGDKSKRDDAKRGFVFCRKCFELMGVKEMKCPNCGAVNSRN